VGLGILGAVDDFYPLPAAARLILQVSLGFVGAVFVIINTGNHSLTGPQLIFFILVAGAILLPVTVNVFNFMDGVNGISAVNMAILAVTYALILDKCGQENFAKLGWVLAAGAVAFMPWNFGNRARMFLGDSGSYFAGAAIGLLIVASSAYGAPIWAVILPFSIYFIDVAQALIHRLRLRKPVGVAHRDHVYHQLVDHGFAHSSVAGLVGAFTLVECMLSLLIVTQEMQNLLVPIFGILVALMYCTLPNLTKWKIKPSH
jgi:UDP-N-acetylmuramyl pentapeptide phosphotransferase/UDP-N-acetylglucosamine-1-phosphate transferase